MFQTTHKWMSYEGLKDYITFKIFCLDRIMAINFSTLCFILLPNIEQFQRNTKYIQYIRNHNTINNYVPTTYLKKNIFVSIMEPCQILSPPNSEFFQSLPCFSLEVYCIFLNKILVNFTLFTALYINEVYGYYFAT